MKIRDIIHDYCSYKSGYMVQWNDTDYRQAGWTWHKTFNGALKSKEKNGGSIYKILGEDFTKKVG